MIKFTHGGSFNKTETFFKRSKSIFDKYEHVLHRYGHEGVLALAAATPIDSALTASSWDYKITKTKNSCRITWTNSNVRSGIPIAILIQYGHGTGTGGYVQGRDYINPATQQIFDRMVKEIWAEVTR